MQLRTIFCYLIFLWLDYLPFFWHAPLWMTQGYLIAVSVLMAISLTRIPEWTAWMILGVVSLWDLFAVLAPCGPLRLLLETAQQREEPIPGLLYSVDRDNVIRARNQPSVAKINTVDDSSENNNDNDKSNIPDTATTNSVNNDENNNNVDSSNTNTDTDNNTNNNNNNNSINDTATSADKPTNTQQHLPSNTEEDDAPTEVHGVKLGLGDFIFYSLLVARAALFDLTTVFACFIGITMGLCATLFLLAIFRKALPALPFSILLGILFYFLTRFLVTPWSQFLTSFN